MYFRQKFTLSLLVTIVSGSIAFAQVVEIPDANLRAVVSDALNLPADGLITHEALAQITYLHASNSTGIITHLTGLEHAVNLIWLSISGHDITDLTPIANLDKLERLFMWHNPISDITPLTDLINLQVLKAAHCRISDISALRSLSNLTELNLQSNNIADIQPLENLTQLTALYLAGNNISDVKPLAHLTRLTTLEIENNKIRDHSPLDGLTLTHFIYDQSCEMPPLPLEPRLENRSFPSVFAAWGGGRTENQPHLSAIEQMAQHDLYFTGPMFGQRFFNAGHAWEIRGTSDSLSRLRNDVLTLNPNIILLVEIRMVTDWPGSVPDDSLYWLRDAEGNFANPNVRRFVNFTHPEAQDIIVQRAVAVSKCGLYDGIFFDH